MTAVHLVESCGEMSQRDLALGGGAGGVWGHTGQAGAMPCPAGPVSLMSRLRALAPFQVWGQVEWLFLAPGVH